MLRFCVIFILFAGRIPAQILPDTWATLDQCPDPVTACHFVSDTLDIAKTRKMGEGEWSGIRSIENSVHSLYKIRRLT
jgi:hypothetical protein